MTIYRWRPGTIVQVTNHHGQTEYDCLNDPDPSRGPVPPGVLFVISWAEGRMGSETLWFPDRDSANRYGEAADDEWDSHRGEGDLCRDPSCQYGSPARLYDETTKEDAP